MPASSPRIVVTEWMDKPAVDLLRECHDVFYAPELVDDLPRLLTETRDADALIVRNRTQVNPELLTAFPALRVVGRLGVGLDNIDVAACEARGISVIPAAGANARSVAEYVLCSTMLLLRGIYQTSAAVADGLWPRQAFINGTEIAGKTLGVIGFGSIGQRTAQLAMAAGMQIVYFERGTPAIAAVAGMPCRPASSLEELLETADAVTLHVPLTEHTRGMLDAAELARMKRGAILINTARGGIVDERALANALRAGHLGGAAIDVFDCEPVGADNPWRGCPNLILTPHVAGLTKESNLRVAMNIAERVAEALAAV
ncbi:hydroxyacid dehydrogenase [Variovorax sp. LjRoot84]|uniref:hydroxyacid dehydrogenase n=1 Tax=unclassified Variovorax TaxID=663243 RepID=UPI003ECF1CA3